MSHIAKSKIFHPPNDARSAHNAFEDPNQRKSYMNIETLSLSERTALLAGLAWALTICARETYEVGTENVLQPQVLRAYNELLHRVTAAVRDHVSGRTDFPLEAVLEMTMSFGLRHNMATQMNWALNQATQFIGG
jgi:hypothetical protein